MEEPVSFTFENTANWMQTPSPVTIQSGETKTIKLVSKVKAERNGRDKDTYSGVLKISGAGETISFQAKNKNR